MLVLNIKSPVFRIAAAKQYPANTTVAQLRQKLELVVGISPENQVILVNGTHLTGVDDRPISAVMRQNDELIITDKSSSQTIDDEEVEKFDISDEAYEQRQDSVRAFMRSNKLGRFTPGAPASEEPDLSQFAIGARCEVTTGSNTKRGVVRYVGPLPPGDKTFIGIEYDEPLGKHDGTYKGTRLFTAGPRRGAFVRPDIVTVGDFPELDPFDDDDEI